MPKSYITIEMETRSRLTAWVVGQLKIREMTRAELAEKRGIALQSLGRKMRLDNYSFDDFLFFVNTFGATVEDIAWIAGRRD
jgi:hypothetical protein